MPNHVLVTGATGYLGQKVSWNLASKGYDLSLCARDSDSLGKLVESIKANFDIQIEQGEFSISDDDAFSEFVNTASREIGAYSGGVHTAGILGPVGHIKDVDRRDWLETVDTNLIGTFTFLQTMAEILVGGEGSLVVLSGGGATSPMPGLSAYAASKAAVVRLVETVALELESKGIRVNSVAPGIMKSQMTQTILSSGPGLMSEAELRKIASATAGTSDSSEKALELIYFLLETKIPGLTGKLISAQWDDWNAWNLESNPFPNADLYSLRRTS